MKDFQEQWLKTLIAMGLHRRKKFTKREVRELCKHMAWHYSMEGRLQGAVLQKRHTRKQCLDCNNVLFQPNGTPYCRYGSDMDNDVDAGIECSLRDTAKGI